MIHLFGIFLITLGTSLMLCNVGSLDRDARICAFAGLLLVLIGVGLLP